VKGFCCKVGELGKLIRGGEIGQDITSWKDSINWKDTFNKKGGFTKRKESKIHLTPFSKPSK
jgi:hypothetical protein